MDIGKIKETPIVDEMQRSYLDYAMSVIVSRALPDVRDGLKPVHRRILYAMHKIGLTHTSRFSKSAKVVGEVLGKYHPHGDMPVYDALVRMAQNFSMRHPLITGQGNFGSVDGDPPAAMRYTEVKMAKIADEMLRDIGKETVPFLDNFDGSLKEPLFLPATLPNLLLMGGDGIAVGMATKIPPHNLGEVVDALVFMIEKSKMAPSLEVRSLKMEEARGLKVDGPTSSLQLPSSVEVAVDDLLKYIKGPDFPTGGLIYDYEEIKNVYATGRGRIIMRGKTEIDEISKGKTAIIISEIPYQVNKASLVAKIAQLVKDKKISEVSDLRDESDRRGIRVVVELKKSAVPKKILNQLFKFTPLQTVFPANIVALVSGTPQTLSLKTILEEYLRHRQITIRRRSEFELKEAKAREHILFGLKIAVDHIDGVIETIKRAQNVEDAKVKLMEKFKLTEIQAQAILDMQLKRLAALERQKIEDELSMVKETIAYLEDLLAHPEKILTVIKNELLKIKEKYSDPRRTRVFKGKVGEFSQEDLILNEETIITLTRSGYTKRLPKGTFRLQRRGGKGVSGMTKKEEDEIEHLTFAQTHDSIMFFTNKGRVFKIRAWEIPEVSRRAKGQAIINLINIEQDELIQSILPISPTTSNPQTRNIVSVQGRQQLTTSCVFLATKKGVVKKTKLLSYKNIKSSGIIAIKLDKDDELVWAKETLGNQEIMLVTRLGKTVRFNESEVRATGRDTRGVAGIKLKKEDFVVAMEAFLEDKGKPKDKRRRFSQDLLTISEKGLGKRTDVAEFRHQHRGGSGVKVANLTKKTGAVAAAFLVDQEIKQIIITSKEGQVIKLPLKNIPRLSRSTQGVILMRFTDKKDCVAAATAI